ncbi:conserved Plasmodium protein, unknown function [Plasmodium gallinaceum]|uniref:Uncharacterized protein n=1 Tax=Plasmodium gallinaceum TaxID=5849 RepID=A0A1J1GW03_PLAGA|nr:conserved Plasmodium protein, unknown function [Plasmodium gallinaceum]CRG96500.1 conserved Plasmodium protein, unknown function [Plasmodium gallinaceum]
MNIDEEILKHKYILRNSNYNSKKKHSKLVSKNKYLEYSYSSPVVIKLKNKKRYSKLYEIIDIHKSPHKKKIDINTTISSCKKSDEKAINLKERPLNKKLDKETYYQNNYSLKKNLDENTYYSNNSNLSNVQKSNIIKKKKGTLKKIEKSNINNSNTYNIQQLNENFYFKEDNDIKENSNEVKLSINNSKCLKSNYILKKLNGEIKELNIKDASSILENYIPYQNNNISTENKFKTKRSLSSTINNLEDLNNLPIVYEERNLDLVKKCREASKKKIINKYCSKSKIPSKIKLPIKKSFKILTNSNLKLKYGDCCLYKENEKKKRPSTTFNYSSKKYRSLSCINMNNVNHNDKNKNREISQKSLLCNSEEFYTTPIGEAKLCGFEKELMKFKSVQNKINIFHPSQVNYNKTINSSNINSVKKNLTPLVLKHSKNMILSKLKKLKPKKINNSKYRSSSLVDNILGKENFSKWNLLENNESLKNTTNFKIENKIINEKRKSKISSENEDLYILNYNKKLNQSKNLNSGKNESPFQINERDLTLSKILAEKPIVKSTEKKKVIEKINDYKVIYKSEDFVGIYKSNEDNEKKKNFIDFTSLLCKPGYIGDYLCETTSTINLSYIKKRKEENKYKKISEDNNNENEKIRENNTSFNNEYYTKENMAKGESEKINVEHQHQPNETTKYRNIFELNKNENDEILYYLKEAVKNSPTINVDLQYIMIIFNEILEKEKKIKYKKELLSTDINEISVINKNMRNNQINNHYNKYIQTNDYLKRPHINYDIYNNNLRCSNNILNKNVLYNSRDNKIKNNKNSISNSYNSYIINNLSNGKATLSHTNSRCIRNMNSLSNKKNLENFNNFYELNKLDIKNFAR